MFEILKKESTCPSVKEMLVAAPRIAKKAKPGQFVMVYARDGGERIPLTIADFDRAAGTITLVFQEVGKSTLEFGAMEPGDRFQNVIGPLGKPSEVEGFKRVVCVGGGIGIAPVYPIARGFKEHGARVISVIGARSKNLLVFEERMRAVSDEIVVCTDDGSYARKALVTEPLVEILKRDGKAVERVVAIGPAIMMKFAAAATKPFGVPTIVSLNAIMVDATGMCGACRVQVGGKTMFSCVDGPDFDGHQVDFDLLMTRQRMYLEEERAAVERYKERQFAGK
ncbi:MAG: sulfide/dihydroorotate dehydrogenase-like FAD/NAD-binding protein [Planctomycetes bacterium]|jgi:ferredoxin--NADP+ reductase|nr:sulfide/dihydroorotate dehydrogenase-like FAD/NAD-binding protein [Planctomycetota bacterium]